MVPCQNFSNSCAPFSSIFNSSTMPASVGHNILITIIIVTSIIHSVTPDSSCSLATPFSSSLNVTNFNRAFNDYLFALGHRANKTGKIFLNSTEQRDCLAAMGTVAGDVVDQLTTGDRNCLNYTVTDVINNLGSDVSRLDQSCQGLGSSDRAYCGRCSTMWKELHVNSTKSDVCRFTVLVTMTSRRINDMGWIGAVYGCLGEHRFTTMYQTGESGDRRNGGRFQSKLGLWILIGILIVILVLVVVFFIAYWKLCRGSRRKPDGDLQKGKDVSISAVLEDSSTSTISVKEIYSATNNFSPSNFIGQGVAGKVYKGILWNGEHVAIKHIINDGQVETFVREVASLSDVQHPNLVALLGYCEVEDECFLVYELCHNGNLSEWLFGKEKKLSWIQRLEIAIDCARGLWFLHTYPDGCIVHRDIKPTNILLSADFQAKLSDFGLSKVMDVGQSFVSSEVRGTFGYVDPEYRTNRHVNASGDVYSFGIVLLQLLSGQRVINLNQNNPTRLDRRAKILKKDGNIAEFADTKMNGDYSAEAFETVLKLALSCTGLKQQRPSMEQVVSRLEKAFSQSIVSDAFSYKSRS